MALGQKLQQLYLHPQSTRRNTLRAADGLALGSCCPAVAPVSCPALALGMAGDLLTLLTSPTLSVHWPGPLVPIER